MNKILIANRGEIAVRVIRTARQQGYRTVVVYSEADADTLAVQLADEAVLIGPAVVSESYLVIGHIIRAAQATGCDAIHPGYGLLSESADFARACTAAGMTLIGPDADAIELMGNKRLAKVAMQQAGVACIAGYQGARQDDQTLEAEAQNIGFPLMIKAAAGGGGRGMRLVTQAADLAEGLRSARSEALSAFGSDELILERALIEPRHIEIQIFADRLGNVVYLGERDCSVQRRHQKVVEEAPSPFVDEQLRQAMGRSAVEVAQACRYVGAGTVEFLVDKDRRFYFLEMNTRLQVEHPVTEQVTGQDLVAWQLAVAEGEALPLQQQQIVLRGHAIEVRLYAEDPRQQFLPQTGTIMHWVPPERAGIRVDHGLCQGQRVTPYYDPMLAKIIATGDTRQQALRRLRSALQDLELLGVHNNKHFLRNVLAHPRFCRGDATTAFIESDFAGDHSLLASEPSLRTLARAALLYYHRDSPPHHGSPWRSAAKPLFTLQLACAGLQYPLTVSDDGAGYRVSCGDQSVVMRLLEQRAQRCVFSEGTVRCAYCFVFDQQQLLLDDGSGHFLFDNMTQRPAQALDTSGNGRVLAVMDGAVSALLVEPGEQVQRGQTVLILDAMKMEHALKADVSGRVNTVNVSAGEQVKSRQLLVSIDSDSEEDCA